MLKIATYNIQFSIHSKAIEKNIVKIVEQGVSIICLQEVILYSKKNNIISRVLNKLGPNWESACHVGEDYDLLSMGTCILWNKKQVKKVGEENILLPFSYKLKLPEKVFSILAGGIDSPFLRRIVSVEFLFKRKLLRVTNVHLDHNGGKSNRKKQLQYLISKLDNNKVFECEILCGDFNNLKIGNETDEDQMYKAILYNYHDLSKDIKWTADLYYIDTSMGNIYLEKLIKHLNIHIRKKLDYIWAKNIVSYDCKMLYLLGSDHFPLIAELSI